LKNIDTQIPGIHTERSEIEESVKIEIKKREAIHQEYERLRNKLIEEERKENENRQKKELAAR